MPDYIDREAFVAKGRERFCANCDRRKGMKNGKMKFVYEIGDAPCRACWVDDMIDKIYRDWDKMLDSIKDDPSPCIWLDSGEFLSDVLSQEGE